MVLSKGGRIIAVAVVHCAAIRVTLSVQLGSGKAIVHQGLLAGAGQVTLVDQIRSSWNSLLAWLQGVEA